MPKPRPQQPIIIRFYKPYGVLTQFTDSEGRPTLADYIDIPDIYAAGRLDKNSEGLLLLTDDPLLKHRLLEPHFAHERTYLAQVERVPDQQALTRLQQGIKIKDYHTKPAETQLLETEPNFPPRDPPIRYRKNVPTAWLSLTLTEGKYHQVRRMTAAVGHPTLRLVRVSIGKIELQGLDVGEWEHLSPKARLGLYQQLKIEPR